MKTAVPATELTFPVSLCGSWFVLLLLNAPTSRVRFGTRSVHPISGHMLPIKVGLPLAMVGTIIVGIGDAFAED